MEESKANAALFAQAPALARENKSLKENLSIVGFDLQGLAQENNELKDDLSKAMEVAYQENKIVKSLNERIKELEKLERSFYVDICRAYNAGKQSMNDQHTAHKNGDAGGHSAFQSSHDYFIGEFPEFKTNVP